MNSITLTKPAWINDTVVQAGTEVEATQEAVDAGYAAFEKRRVREAIAAAAGDSDALLGTSIDVGHLLIVELGKFLQSVASAGKLEDVKAAAKPLAELLAGAAAAKFPYQMDGAPAILDEVVERAEKTMAAFEGKAVEDPATPTSPEGATVTEVDAPPAEPYKSPTMEGFAPNRAADGEAPRADT